MPLFNGEMSALTESLPLPLPLPLPLLLLLSAR
ncbi:hypothetical protein PshuTeo1_40100 [Pseudomonas hunanensis]|nr:hypothetical protein PshuTeo1_40100 [Pseudomonas hunanensis]